MTTTEFKAFLEGMDVQACPTPEQWARIKAKIEALEALRFDYPIEPRIMPATGTPYIDTTVLPYVTCANMTGLGQDATAAIFDDLDGLYET